MQYFHCEICKKPLTVTYFKLCNNCQRLENFNGGVYKKSITRIKWEALEYQYFLSKAVREYTPNAQFSGKRADRIPVTIPKADVDRALVYLHKAIQDGFGKMSYRVYEIIDKNDHKFRRRLLFNCTLFCIAYHIKNSPAFASEQHFIGSMCTSMYDETRRSHFRHKDKEWMPSEKEFKTVKNRQRTGEMWMSLKQQRVLVAGVLKAVGLVIKHYG